MKLNNLIDFLRQVPDQYLDYDVVFSEFSDVDDTDLTVRLDKPLVGFFCDENTQEIVFLDNENMDYYEKRI